MAGSTVIRNFFQDASGSSPIGGVAVAHAGGFEASSGDSHDRSHAWQRTSSHSQPFPPPTVPTANPANLSGQSTHGVRGSDVEERIVGSVTTMPFADERNRVVVVAYRPEWPEEFADLAELLWGAAGELAVAIDHIGSTSVPGLAAKDCIDVQVRVRSIDESRQIPLLEGIGFRCRPEQWNRVEVSGGKRCSKLVFAPPAGARSCNVHLREAAGSNTRYALLFRDFLRADEPARRAWGAFKQRLALSAPDLMDYGQIKAPATEVLMAAAERWANHEGWSVG
ncbi:GrpB family protein [Streptomyces sp. NPDC056452]|uniref:GrpB family protein n=1 Tax=Streptomyces sp. NPDC056452 TaxID=3345821 RepID=UPI00369CEA1C